MSNNLINETSLYLKEYFNTSIDWYPWGEEALQKAKREQKPIFLSIGYSGSYWCEIMKEESFNSPIITDLLNQHFIAIKVDKDERTDIDKYYKHVYKLMNGQNCASPISIFLTEDLEPFYSATYIAPYPKGNVLGFEELLKVVIDKYAHDKATMIKKGQEVLTFLNPKKHAIEATRINLNIINTITLHAKELYDNEYGGFGREPKFLNISTLDLLLDLYEETKNNEILSMVKTTLRSMYDAEIYNKKENSFYRYANQKDWNYPRQETMSYDNAQLAILYWRMFTATNEAFYKEVAFTITHFLIRCMSDQELFYTNSVIKKSGELITDTKIITSFNAMVIETLLILGNADISYQEMGIEKLDKLLEKYFVDHELYHTSRVNAFLEDYAYLGYTLLTAYRYTKNQRYLILAETFAHHMIEKFYDYGFWKFSTAEIVVYDDIYDSLYPSAIATATLFLHQLSFFVDSDYNQFVFKTIEINSYNLMRQPLSSPKMSKVLLRHLKKML